jgi:proteic killer suppression protein
VALYAGFVIKSFRSKQTNRLFSRERVREFQSIERAALKKLVMLDAASNLSDLAAPPGNRLELLHGDREGEHSIRINDQWRVCFVWQEGDAYGVEITDYH